MYVLHLEAIERETLAAMHVAAVFRAAGEDVDIPTFAAERASFDEALNAPPAPVSGRAALLRQMGA